MDRRAIYTDADSESLTRKGAMWNFHEADTREHLHSLHPYPAKFIPQIPRTAIANWAEVGEMVYDPFCGCGTTLLEASLLGRPSIGTDNNPVAILVCRAKCAAYKPSDLKRMKAFALRVEGELKRAKGVPRLIPTNKNFLYWFNDEVLDRMAVLKGWILAEPEPSRSLLMAVFSSIVVRVSYQDSDTRYARIERNITGTDVRKAFNRKLVKVLRRLSEVGNDTRAPVAIRQEDALRVHDIDSSSVRLIVTSPPYLNAYDYHKYHRQRIHWIDGSVEFARDLEIGGHDEFTRPNATPDQYFSDMEECFDEWIRVLRPGGRALVVIGDAIVNKQPVKVADRFVRAFESRGVKLEERWIRKLHSTKRAFNIRNSRMSHEHVLLFRKP